MVGCSCVLKKWVLNQWRDEKEEKVCANYQSGHQGAVVFSAFIQRLSSSSVYSVFLSRAALIRLRGSGAAAITL